MTKLDRLGRSLEHLGDVRGRELTVARSPPSSASPAPPSTDTSTASTGTNPSSRDDHERRGKALLSHHPEGLLPPDEVNDQLHRSLRLVTRSLPTPRLPRRGISGMRLGEELPGVCLEVALAPSSAEEVDIPGVLRAVPSGADVDLHAAHRVDRHLHRAWRDAGAQLAGRLTADQLGQDGQRDPDRWRPCRPRLSGSSSCRSAPPCRRGSPPRRRPGRPAG